MSGCETIPYSHPGFVHMGADHAKHVAALLAEMLGGPPEYSGSLGGNLHFNSNAREACRVTPRHGAVLASLR
jgi:truncated hemoglobin YjbI